MSPRVQGDKRYAEHAMGCSRCPDTIRPGDLIVLSRDGGWIHGRCFRRAKPASRPVRKGVAYRNTLRIARAARPENPDVYVIVATGTNMAKIGISADPRARLRELQVGNPYNLRLALVIPHGGRRLERVLHKMCRPCSARPGQPTEWFKLGKGGLAQIKRYVQDNGLRTL